MIGDNGEMTYTVDITGIPSDSDSPEEAARDILNWIRSGEDLTLTVTDEDGNKTFVESEDL